MHPLPVIILLCTLITIALSASPPSFCKCTCFTNSTIIQLGSTSEASAHDPSPAPLSLRSLLEIRARGSGGSSCNKCNRAFCLAQGIPFCKGAEEKDVFTTCFQRDSRKDQIIVLLFIATTVGLLIWAGVRRLLEKRSTSTGRGTRPEGLRDYTAVDGR